MPRARRFNRRTTPHRGARSAFTLMEVLLVLIILVIIGSLAVNIFTGTQDRASLNAAKANIGLVKSAIDRYRMDMNKYPTKLTDLWEKPSDQALAEKWTSEYIEKLKPDPWGNEYQYRGQGEKNVGKYDLWSNGPDGQSGTDDDIGNWS